jgi:hypothetical protein
LQILRSSRGVGTRIAKASAGSGAASRGGRGALLRLHPGHAGRWAGPRGLASGRDRSVSRLVNSYQSLSDRVLKGSAGAPYVRRARARARTGAARGEAFSNPRTPLIAGGGAGRGAGLCGKMQAAVGAPTGKAAAGGAGGAGAPPLERRGWAGQGHSERGRQSGAGRAGAAPPWGASVGPTPTCRPPRGW